MNHAELEARLSLIRSQLPARTSRMATFAKVSLEDLIEAMLLDRQRSDERDPWLLNCLADALRMIGFGYYRRAAHQIAFTATPYEMRGRMVGRRMEEVEPLTIDGLLDDLEYLRTLPVRLRKREHEGLGIPIAA